MRECFIIFYLWLISDYLSLSLYILSSIICVGLGQNGFEMSFCVLLLEFFPFFIRFKFCVDDKYSLSIYIFHKGEGKTIICFFYKECVVDNIALQVDRYELL